MIMKIKALFPSMEFLLYSSTEWKECDFCEKNFNGILIHIDRNVQPALEAEHIDVCEQLEW